MLADQGATALTVILAGSIVVPLTILGVVIRYFFKHARRFDAEQRQVNAETRGPGTAS